jgi:hypothetical protein
VNIFSSAQPLPSFHSTTSFIAFSRFEALNFPSLIKLFLSEKTCFANLRYLSIASGTESRSRPRRRAISLSLLNISHHRSNKPCDIPTSTCAANHVKIVSWKRHRLQLLRLLHAVHDFIEYNQFRDTSNATTI